MVAFRDGVRQLAREHKLPALLELCDSLRDGQLVDLGVRLEDRADGPSLWKLDDPATLRCAPLPRTNKVTHRTKEADDDSDDAARTQNSTDEWRRHPRG
eukprot:1189322-Prorocentrum_minimum.AAC.1